MLRQNGHIHTQQSGSARLCRLAGALALLLGEEFSSGSQIPFGTPRSLAACPPQKDFTYPLQRCVTFAQYPLSG